MLSECPFAVCRQVNFDMVCCQRGVIRCSSRVWASSEQLQQHAVTQITRKAWDLSSELPLKTAGHPNGGIWRTEAAPPCQNQTSCAPLRTAMSSSAFKRKWINRANARRRCAARRRDISSTQRATFHLASGGSTLASLQLLCGPV